MSVAHSLSALRLSSLHSYPCVSFFSSPAPPTPQLYTLSLHDALPIAAAHAAAVSSPSAGRHNSMFGTDRMQASCSIGWWVGRSEEHTSELQSLRHLVCRLLLEKKKKHTKTHKTKRK